MKKIILLIGLSLLMGTSAHAACAEGTEITGKNGHVYCKSNITMNWYTAFAWCDTQGRTLATVNQMCDIDEAQKWDGDYGDGKCLNLVGAFSDSNFIWSSIPNGSTYAFYVNLSAGGVHNTTRTNYYYALCW